MRMRLIFPDHIRASAAQWLIENCYPDLELFAGAAPKRILRVAGSKDRVNELTRSVMIRLRAKATKEK